MAQLTIRLKKLPEEKWIIILDFFPLMIEFRNNYQMKGKRWKGFSFFSGIPPEPGTILFP